MKSFIEEFKKHVADQITLSELVTTARNSDAKTVLPAMLESEIANKNWGNVQSLVVVAQAVLSKECIGLLCDLLDDSQPGVLLEDIVDALSIMPDAQSVPSLARKLLWEMPGDHYHHFNVKCAFALAQIGGSEAIEALRAGTASHIKRVREASHYELQRIEGNLES